MLRLSVCVLCGNGGAPPIRSVGIVPADSRIMF